MIRLGFNNSWPRVNCRAFHYCFTGVFFNPFTIFSFCPSVCLMSETLEGSVWTVFPLASHWMMCRRWEQFSQSIGHIQRKDNHIDTKLRGCRWKSFPALCLAVMWLPGCWGFFSPPSSLSLCLCRALALQLFTPSFMLPPPARSIAHWCCFYDPFFYDLPFSLFSLSLSSSLLTSRYAAAGQE